MSIEKNKFYKKKNWFYILSLIVSHVLIVKKQLHHNSTHSIMIIYVEHVMKYVFHANVVLNVVQWLRRLELHFLVLRIMRLVSYVCKMKRLSNFYRKIFLYANTYWENKRWRIRNIISKKIFERKDVASQRDPECCVRCFRGRVRVVSLE